METINHLKEELNLIEQSLNDPNYFVNEYAKNYWINRAEQLKENISSINLKLTPEILEDIEAVHTAIPNPAP